MKKVELFVGLKVADNTALTAFHALQRLGFKNLLSLKRYHYYAFWIDGDEQDFRKDIVKVDPLVNSNKNTASFGRSDGSPTNQTASVLVRELGDTCLGITKTLRDGLGMKGIQKMERGILWELTFDASIKDAKPKAEAIAKSLLYNPHYQEFVIL